jgi:hypothetical protein
MNMVIFILAPKKIPHILDVLYLDCFILFILTHRLSNHFHDFCDKFLNKSYSIKEI